MERFGHNRGYIDELYSAFRADPSSVSEAWREFFVDYPGSEPTAKSQAPGGPSPARTAPAAVPGADAAEPLKGVALRIVESMTASLDVPTATSVRTMPVKILEENRRILNQHLANVSGTKISFTHLIAWGFLRAIERVPRMNARYTEIDGRPHRIAGSSIHLGVAIDVERDGQRQLLVPNVKNADRLAFPEFVAAYDDRIVRARAAKLTVDDLTGTTITLTNPGMLGTTLSVPRLMQGQSVILGVGSIDFPTEYAGMAPEVISDLGLSKVMTVTSTYDHRVIQGADSGALLAELERLLQGGDGFYERIFREIGVPLEPLGWTADRNPAYFSGGTSTEAIAKQAGVLQLIRSYRVRGHLWANIDPLGYAPEPNPELELSHYGLSLWDLDRRFIAGGLAGRTGTLTLREILETIRETYCGHVGVEYMHIQDSASRQWLQERMERTRNAEPLTRDDQLRILERLNAAEAFETFLGTNYVGQKRFSLEGAETVIPMLDALLVASADHGIQRVLFGMAHRGRLNVLANVIGKSAGQIFREFEGDIDPTTTHGSGDVKYHLGASGSYETPSGSRIDVEVASNPSHLEAVDPVVEGLARALQDVALDVKRKRILAVLIHGDAAFSGQGVVAETLHLSQLKGYRTGGTVHLVINNQIGFTTGPADLRSSHYPTDAGKMIRAPIFHVNGDQPEHAVRVIRLALDFRQTFERDVIIDLVCYRRWGHNEADDPSYTHPILYERIQRQRSVRKLYTERLLRSGEFDVQTAERALDDFRRRLSQVHDAVRQAPAEVGCTPAQGSDPLEPSAEPTTAVDRAALDRVLDGLERIPEGFVVHPKLARQLARRREHVTAGEIDWALAESLAFGTLVSQGVPVRLSGEDSGRGTFSQRHSILYDHRSGAAWVPLDNLAEGQAPFHVHDSMLSEFAVLGFEYGYSVGRPEALVLWEAQFGDFVNGAQVIIDQFLASAEEKWDQRSGVVLLLPHGYEGQGPEHSSARVERFLQLAAMDNIRVAQPSTPAQYFHLLRSQALDPRKKPLIVLTPKSLLRHRACVSAAHDLTDGEFLPVIEDSRVDSAAVQRVLFCSGRVYFDLAARHEQSAARSIAIHRVERLYPFPSRQIEEILARHKNADEVAWVQDEPQNMGAWTSVAEHLRPMLAPDQPLRYVGRSRAASPATGSARRHATEQEAILVEALERSWSETRDVLPAAARREIR